MDVMIPELELQQELQRFATSFIERITQATEALQRSSRSDVRDEAMRKNLLYASSALEIATGPASPVNLLDMFVFLHLSRRVLETHWIPTLYGEGGTPLDTAFTKAEQELDTLARRALGPQGVAQLTDLVDAWIADNPGQTRVEGIRLSDFAAAAGSAAASRVLQAKGLLSSISVASQAGNQAMAIAERAMFLVHRLPYLLRLHVRLAVRDVINDAMLRFKTGDELAGIKRFARRGAAIALLATVSAGMLWLVPRRRRT